MYAFQIKNDIPIAKNLAREPASFGKKYMCIVDDNPHGVACWLRLVASQSQQHDVIATD